MTVPTKNVATAKGSKGIGSVGLWQLTFNHKKYCGLSWHTRRKSTLNQVFPGTDSEMDSACQEWKIPVRDFLTLGRQYLGPRFRGDDSLLSRRPRLFRGAAGPRG